MQAKIIDFASDKIVKSLQKIEKNDVKNAYSSLSSKLRKNKRKKSLKKNVTNNGEYCENQSEYPKQSETVVLIEANGESSVDGSL